MTEAIDNDTSAEHELDPRAISLERLTGRLVALGLTAASLVALLFVLVARADLSVWGRAALGAMWLALSVALAWRAEVWPARAYAHTRYRLDADGLQIGRGVWWRTVIHVPRSRVQHTDVSQGPLERSYGLGTLVVYTAGTQHARVALPGLAYEVALALRDELRVERDDDSV
ncbi:MAG: PH domain-containing protein [Acidobacteriota bacterium]|nr:PH domain-containing protein [Acidobacteriota bacterium]